MNLFKKKNILKFLIFPIDKKSIVLYKISCYTIQKRKADEPDHPLPGLRSTNNKKMPNYKTLSPVPARG